MIKSDLTVALCFTKIYLIKVSFFAKIKASLSSSALAPLPCHLKHCKLIWLVDICNLYYFNICSAANLPDCIAPLIEP